MMMVHRKTFLPQKQTCFVSKKYICPGGILIIGVHTRNSSEKAFDNPYTAQHSTEKDVGEFCSSA